mgnify:CR=1 FL=1
MKDTNIVKSELDAVREVDLDQPLADYVRGISGRISGRGEGVEGSCQVSTATVDHPFQSETVERDQSVSNELHEHLMLLRMNLGRENVGIAKFREFVGRCVAETLGHLQIVVGAGVLVARSFEIEMRERDVDPVTYGGVDRPAAVEIVLVLVREIRRLYRPVETVQFVLAYCERGTRLLVEKINRSMKRS